MEEKFTFSRYGGQKSELEVPLELVSDFFLAYG
jgi:hypothetical protein